MIWSENNPYFFKGKAGEGVGGPHVGLNYIWPMSII
ncbi:glycoside hydrolase family 125 protein [Bacteroides fragilis]|nr:glycoside hydrolase family 125 protein [Bacteroides fragilis]